MASSTLTGDRRWSTARKSGMTVLGKVPKPINLPSQRLENHGLDPNVEIVPKGTLTWGTRPSSATTNAWASPSVLSPKTDGSTGSPVNGRPSSSGSGPRPSTAGSDRSYELASNAWGPNSRPSSASGLVASNQSSLAATRPRSAETRPRSSQMSRFAESIGESNLAWGPPRTPESMGSASSRANEFMLSSGDFPTLGSDKNSEPHVQRGHSSQGRPSSASGRSSIPKEVLEPPPRGDGKSETYSDIGKTNCWKTDDYRNMGGNAPPSWESWQNDPQHGQGYSTGNIPPHQFDSWRGPPVHSPDVVWYGGGTAGVPYRPPGHPGSYPVEPFGYYPPQLPVRPLTNSQSVQRPGSGSGPGGFHSKNGDMYHPHVSPESFMVSSHPIMPMRPGVYQSSPPYDGFYGPRAGFVGSMDREVASMGMRESTCAHDQYSRNANVDPGNFHNSRSAHASITGKDEVKLDETDETRQGQLKILLKQHDGREDECAQEKKEEFAGGGAPLRLNQQEAGKQDRSWKRNTRNERTATAKPAAGEMLSVCAINPEVPSAETAVLNPLKDVGKVANESVARKLGNADIQDHGQQQSPVIKKNAALIGKIESLNSKARTVDVQGEIGPFSSKEKTKGTENPHEDERKKLNFNNSTSNEDHSKSAEVAVVPHQAGASLENKIQENIVVASSSRSQVIATTKSKSLVDGKKIDPQVRKDIHGMQVRVDHHAKSGFSSEDGHEMVNKSSGKDSLVNANLTKVEVDPTSSLDSHPSQQIVDKQVLLDTAKSQSMSQEAYTIDSADQKTQRAKLKEIAAQRARQLQKEEEERTREQKAKALAKLEELNRRSLAQTPNQKLDDGNTHAQLKDSEAGSALRTDPITIETSGSNSMGVMKASDDSLIKCFGDATAPASNILSQESKPAVQVSAVPFEKALSSGQEMQGNNESTQKADSNFQESNFPKNKQMGYRKRQNSSQEKNQDEQPISAGSGSPKSSGEFSVQAATNSSLSGHEEPSTQHKKKNNRSTRSKNKLEEAPLSSILPSPVVIDVEKVSADVDSAKPIESTIETALVPAEMLKETVGSEGSGEVTVTSSTQRWAQANGGQHGRMSSQWKPNPPRRSTRNHLVIRPADKFHANESVIWAPVKQADKNAQPEEVSQNCKAEDSSSMLVKNGSDPQSGMKTKRAEMERYVPKHVAKELSHQEIAQQHSPPTQTVSSDISAKPDSGLSTAEDGRLGTLAGGPDCTADIKTVEDNKSHKRGKMHASHASWRQRVSASSSSVSQCSRDVSVASDPSKFVQQSSNQHQASNVDSLPEGQLKPDNHKNTSENLMPAEPTSLAAVKDQAAMSKQKNQRFKVHRGPGSASAHPNNKDLPSFTTDKHDIRLPVVNAESDGRVGLRHENQNAGLEQPKSQWQPKSQAHTYSQRQGNKGSAGHRVSSQTKASDKDSTPKGTGNHDLGDDDKDSSNQRTGVTELTNVHHQEKREGNQKSTNAESNSNVDDQQELPTFPAMRRHGQHNGRFNRGHGASYRGGGPRDLVQDVGKQNPYFSGDKQKNGAHYGYQQFGSHNKPSDSAQQGYAVSEEVQEVPQASGSRHRERGQNHSRRGGANFYGRGGGPAVRVGDHYCGGE